MMTTSTVTVAAAKSSTNLHKRKETKTDGSGAGGTEEEIPDCNAAPATSVGLISENGASTHVLQVETFKTIVDVHFPSDRVVRVISLSLSFSLSLSCVFIHTIAMNQSNYTEDHSFKQYKENK